MAASCVYFIDRTGKLILGRDYRGDCSILHLDELWSCLSNNNNDGGSGKDGKASIFLERSNSSPELAALSLLSGQSTPPPVIHIDGITFVYLQRPTYYLVALAKGNANVITIMLFLTNLISVFSTYFGDLDDSVLRDNFVLAYELLDEMMDHGYPQSTDARALKPYVTQQAHKKHGKSVQRAEQDASTLTSHCPWRVPGIKHKRNEIYLDVVESINLVMGIEGSVISADIQGVIKCRSCLSGMPDLKLGLADTVQFEDRAATSSATVNTVKRDPTPSPTLGTTAAKDAPRPRGSSVTKLVPLKDLRFHQCVRLDRFASDRVISFIPPDGEFHLMRYHCDISEMLPNGSNSTTPLMITCNVEKFSTTSLAMSIALKTMFDTNSAATDIRITVPMPPLATGTACKPEAGYAQFMADKQAVVWKIAYMTGQREAICKINCKFPVLTAEMDADDAVQSPSSTESAASKSLILSRMASFFTNSANIINVSFEMPYYTASGMQVRYLKVMEKSGYQALPWVRYITCNGVYQFRMPIMQPCNPVNGN